MDYRRGEESSSEEEENGWRNVVPAVKSEKVTGEKQINVLNGKAFATVIDDDDAAAVKENSKERKTEPAAAGGGDVFVIGKVDVSVGKSEKTCLNSKQLPKLSKETILLKNLSSTDFTFQHCMAALEAVLEVKREELSTVVSWRALWTGFTKQLCWQSREFLL